MSDDRPCGGGRQYVEHSNTARSQSEEREDSERLLNAPPRRERTSATTARDLNCASITEGSDERDDRQREISTAPPRREGSDERDDSDSNNIDKKYSGYRLQQ